MAGYVKIWTTVRHNEDFLSLSGLERSVYLQLLVWCKDQRDDGQVIAKSVSEFARTMSISRPSFERIVQKMTTIRLIRVSKKSNGVITIEIPNYKTWQGLTAKEVAKKRRNRCQKRATTKPDQTRPDQTKPEQTIPPDKSGDRIPYDKILEDLNRKAGRNFRWESKDGKLATFCDEIRGRWKEGYDLKDFFYVHTVMVAEWGEDEESQRWLQPSTLYRKSKFPNYLGRSLAEKGIRIQDRITAEDQIVDKTFKWRQLNVEEPKLVKAVRIKEQVWYQVEGGELRSVNHSTFLATHERTNDDREAEQKGS